MTKEAPKNLVASIHQRLLNKACAADAWALAFAGKRLFTLITP